MLYAALLLWLVLINGFLFYRFFKLSLKWDLDFTVSFIASNGIALFIARNLYNQIRLHQSYPEFFTVWSWINWFLVYMLFFLFMFSYMVRRPPVARANRWSEIIPAAFCVVLPIFIAESITWQAFPVVMQSPMLLDWLKPFYVQTPVRWNIASIILMLFGNGLAVAAIVSLRRSFSVFAEARAVVSHGPYRYIRHPMYFGEILSAIGVFLLAPSKANIVFTVLFILGLWFRARVEEKKLAAHLPEYTDYRKSVRSGVFSGG